MWTKTEKMNPVKFQHIISRGRPELKVFFLKGLFFTYLTWQLGLKPSPTYSKPKDGGAAGPGAGSSGDVLPPAVIAGKVSVKQAALDKEEVGIHTSNALQRAAFMYSSHTTFFKQQMICTLMSPTQAESSRAAKDLGNPENTIEWETNMILSGIDLATRQVVYQLNFVRNYENFGIPVSWKACSLASLDCEISFADAQCCLAWDICFAHARNRESRYLKLKIGYPRHNVLILSETHRLATVAQLKEDFDNFRALSDHDSDVAALFTRRSLFQRTSVMQLVECFKLDGWVATHRIGRAGGGMSISSNFTPHVVLLLGFRTNTHTHTYRGPFTWVFVHTGMRTIRTIITHESSRDAWHTTLVSNAMPIVLEMCWRASERLCRVHPVFMPCVHK